MKFSIFFLISLYLFAQDAEFQEGKKIYNATCISCHGKNGETNPAMKLIVDPRKLELTLLTPEQSFKIIKFGANYWGAHADIMPSFKNVYKDKQIQNITYYISQAFNPNRDKKIQKLLASSEDFLDSKLSLSLGKKVWLKKCAKCHGSTGNARSEYIEISKVNDKFIYPYNLTRTLLNENQIFLYAKYGGKYWGADKSDMPAWEDKYNDFTLRSVAHYIKKNIVKIKN